MSEEVQHEEWEKVGGGGDLLRWKEAGQNVVGVYMGRQEGSKFPTGILDVDGADVFFAMPTVLQNRFAAIPENTKVKIVYLGEKKSKSMRSFQAFDVFVPKGTHLIEEEVPF